MKKRTEAEWEGLLREYQASGKTQNAWCEIKGININTLQDRLNKQKKQGIVEKEVAWVSVTQQEAEGEEKGIEISIGGYKIKVTQDFDETIFLKVCRALEKLC